MLKEFKILLVDDEPGVHDATKLVLGRIRFEGRPIRILHAYSGAEARPMIAANPDMAIAIVDVVMETEHAGLDFVRHVRDELQNKLCRIILRTGQPGSAPERQVVQHLEIDDYKDKTELTADRLFTAVYTALRAYHSLLKLQRTTEGLNRILDAAGTIFGRAGLIDFMRGTLEQMLALVAFDADGIVLAGALAARKSGVELSMVVGTGAFASHGGDPVEKLLPPAVIEAVSRDDAEPGLLTYEDGVALVIMPRLPDRYIIWIPLSGGLSKESDALLILFAQKLAMSIDNALLQQEIIAAQEDVLGRICEVVESRSKETGQHVRRMSRYSRLMAELLGLPHDQVEIITAAAPLHDVGKIGIPDAVLNKPGRLVEDEMDVMRTHAEIGYSVLSASQLSIVKSGAEIARCHHEHWNGGGYPRHLAGEDIPLFARIVAVADVFDALISKRVYKEAFGADKALEIIREGAGKQFDPNLVKLLEENYERFVAIHSELAD